MINTQPQQASLLPMKQEVLQQQIMTPPQTVFIHKEESNFSEVSFTLKALTYKYMKLQSRNYCSNICQILTPILCLLFTLAIRQIVQGVTTGKIKSFDFPQPLNLPMINTIAYQPLGLTCQQNYYYEIQDPLSQQYVDKIMKYQLKTACNEEQSNSLSLSPQFKHFSNVNNATYSIFAVADKEQFERGNDIKTQIPDGIIKFKKIRQKQLHVNLGINDNRVPQYHKNNGVTKIMIKTSNLSTIVTYLRVTEGMMALIEKVTSSFLHQSQKKEVIAGSFMYMPFSGQDKAMLNKAINIIGSGLYPLGLSLLLPVFLYALVSEKEEKQIEIMKMNGLNQKLYWVGFFINSFIISLFSCSIFYFFGYFVLQIQFFTKTSSAILWLLFLCWSIALISLTNLVQIFIDSAKTGTIVGYILSIFSTLIGVVISNILYPSPLEMPLYLVAYPPFALARSIYLIGFACADTIECFRTVDSASPELIRCLVVLALWIFGYIGSIYLGDMVQQQYGVAKNAVIFKNCSRYCCFGNQNSANDQELVQTQNRNLIQVDEVNNLNIQLKNIEKEQSQETMVKPSIDNSVLNNIQEVNNSQKDNKPLIIKGLSKKYKDNNGEKEKIALKPLWLQLQKQQIFGLLGPNGAGKTTLISVLTGMYPQNQGNAWINGNQIGFPSTNKLIGVCPQFDILWPDLTVEQHLYFYATLKKVNTEQIQNKIDEILDDVDLITWRNFPAKELSGGMQRRLSIAIALVGSPKVVFLDEPSSGLDPYHKRQIWDILLKCKKKTSIFLTSHLMDEVEALCDRIGIINYGQLRCVGAISELKQRFGKGYRVTLSYSNILLSSSSQQKNKRPLIVDKLLNSSEQIEIVNELDTRMVLKVEKRQILNCINELRKNDEQVKWIVHQPSLYDVFMHFVK